MLYTHYENHSGAVPWNVGVNAAGLAIVNQPPC